MMARHTPGIHQKVKNSVVGIAGLGGLGSTVTIKIWVAASGVAGYGDNNEIKTVRFSSRIFIVGDQKAAAQPGIGSMAPRVGIVAHHQANTVLRILLGEEKE
jgi:sulfur carrier protein ThiS adenylyltransferase